MIGGNLPENRELETKLLTNDEVLAVNQEGQHPKQLLKTDSSMIWVSIAPGAGARYVALFNTGNNAATVAVNFASLGVKGSTGVRDLWNKTDLGVFKREYAAKINAHGAILLKISGKSL